MARRRVLDRCHLGGQAGQAVVFQKEGIEALFQGLCQPVHQGVRVFHSVVPMPERVMRHKGRAKQRCRSLRFAPVLSITKRWNNIGQRISGGLDPECCPQAGPDRPGGGSVMIDWDDAYANGAHIPQAETYPPRWADAAAAFREELGARARLALPYGSGERQALDLFLPDEDMRGTVVFVHGGYWRAFDRSAWSHLAAGPLARGWAVAMPSYDLCPDVSISDITRQIAAAVQEVGRLVEGPISLAGHSAGGHLVARMLDPMVIGADLASRFRHVLPISPLSDLRPLLRTAMNGDLRLTMDEARAESPVLMRIRHDVPVTAWVGGGERPAFVDQARWLATAWGAELVVTEGEHHFNVIDALADPTSDMVRRLTG